MKEALSLAFISQHPCRKWWASMLIGIPIVLGAAYFFVQYDGALGFYENVKITLGARVNVQDNVLPTEFSDGGTLLVFAHQDDDVLWMFPFWGVAQKFILSAMPATPLHVNIVNKTPSTYAYSAKWLKLYGTMDVGTYIATYKKNLVSRQALISEAALEMMLAPYISAATTKRIVTHNNWGEYGHEQHRLVNRVVRKLARLYKKDVWALSSVVDMHKDTYVDRGNLSTLASFQITYSEPAFYAIRKLYLDEDLTQAPGSNYLTTWTWNSAAKSYPYGTRTYVKLVDKGVDKTLANAQISQILKDQSSYAGPYDTQSLFGTMMVRSGYCKGPIPSGDMWAGFLNVPAQCTNTQPSCADGFNLVVTGNVPDSAGAYTTYSCVTQENSQPLVKEKAKLYGAAMVAVSNGVTVSCGGTNGNPLGYPFTSCDSNKIPVCASGFRRISTGSISASATLTYKYYSCESMSTASVVSPRRGGLYGSAILVQNADGTLRSCAGPRGEVMQAPIKCVNNMPTCDPGYRRFMTGTLTAGDGSIEKYMSCESM